MLRRPFVNVSNQKMKKRSFDDRFHKRLTGQRLEFTVGIGKGYRSKSDMPLYIYWKAI